jgi:hypothetical protein
MPLPIPSQRPPSGVREVLLALTLEIRHVPLDKETLDLHVRAFELRRRVREWNDHPPRETERQETLAELTALRETVRRWPYVAAAGGQR